MSWHTFRHTFSSILKSNGEDVKVVQELLRHSTSRMTLELTPKLSVRTSGQPRARLWGMIRPKESVFSVYRDKQAVSDVTS
jgi:integrase